MLPDPMSLVRSRDDPVVELIIIEAALESLGESRSIAEYYGRRIQTGDESFISARDCAELARQTLSREQNRYVQSCNEIIKSITDAGADRDLASRDEAGLNHLVESSLETIASELPNGHHPELSEPNHLRCQLYVHIGYLVHRIAAGIVRNGRGYNPAMNDSTDSLLCLHLRLDREDLFVTGDRRLAETIQSVISAHDKCFPQKATKCGVQLLPEYKESRQI